ncbi:hypothetical protein CDV31_006831 [Fusarium ambrosium]|uniref:Uncharacterized protein n=1 Tax=Fusarium ambrosium TaxID=131363 RepID=A0A428UAG0_9HYPO|nr:hypothetical protein CDV31_006831 [Fusarium ambrosium]
MKICVALSFFGLILTPAATLPAASGGNGEAQAIVNTFEEFSGLIKETAPIIEDIDFDNAQPTAEASRHHDILLKDKSHVLTLSIITQLIRDKLDKMLRTCVILVEKFYEPKDGDTVKALKEDEQQAVCTKFGQFTSEFLDFLLELHTVSVGIDAKTKGVTKRVLYVVEQFFVGFDLLRHGPLRTIVPVCKGKAEANANKILNDLKVSIRAYGGTTDCSRLGGPMVNERKTCPGSGHSVWQFPGGIQF